MPDQQPPHDPPDELDPHAFAQHLIDHFGSPQAALGHFGVGSPFGAAALSRPRPKLLPRRKTKATYVVRVDLDDAKPPIWRRLRLASDMNLARLHDILQIAMGWTNSHLHHFQMGPDARDFRMTPFLTNFDLEEGERDGVHERDVRLDQVLAAPGQRLFYEYDFGDSWGHTLKLEKVEHWDDDAPEAVCVTGRRACPPEDVGGIPGYEEALAALRGEPGTDPEWTHQLLDWLPPGYDPEQFDADDVNDGLRHDPLDLSRWHPGLARLLTRGGAQFSPIAALVTRATAERLDDLTDDEVDAATRRYRHLLVVVGDGVKLTQAGYLPPALVKRLHAELDLADDGWPFPASREDKTRPVLTLRESATALGLLRRQHGKLLPTASGRRLAADPRGMLKHIRGRVPVGRRDFEQDAGLLALLYAAIGDDLTSSRHPRAGGVYASLGWTSPAPMGTALWYDSEPTRDVLTHLAGRAPSEARTRIARALLARP